MKSLTEHLRVKGARVRLAGWNPRSTPGCDDKEKAVERLAGNLERIDELQYLLSSEARQSLLIVLQGMDGAGKDGLIRKVMTAFNAQGCKVWSFKVPTVEEAGHDFLWRIHRAAPSAGEVAIFNRSHYEDVLVVRVHDLVPQEVWKQRYEVINQFERLLVDRGTRVLKFYLHISREEQRQRLLARLDHPLKRWKFSDADLVERAQWRKYQRAFEDALGRCSTKHAPWFIIPADRKWYRDFAVSQIVADEMDRMNPQLPKARLQIKKLRALLAG